MIIILTNSGGSIVACWMFAFTFVYLFWWKLEMFTLNALISKLSWPSLLLMAQSWMLINQSWPGNDDSMDILGMWDTFVYIQKKVFTCVACVSGFRNEFKIKIFIRRIFCFAQLSSIESVSARENGQNTYNEIYSQFAPIVGLFSGFPHCLSVFAFGFGFNVLFFFRLWISHFPSKTSNDL